MSDIQSGTSKTPNSGVRRQNSKPESLDFDPQFAVRLRGLVVLGIITVQMLNLKPFCPG